jgi:3-methylcrotonyl-CoA carboxylase alpha subunit
MATRGGRLFSKILIANRGEIAVRVIRTARRLGIGSVAVYSEADAGALHVALADEAYPVGPAPARESYLRIDRILEAARRSGAQAIHPGYGFLSENAEFAEACAAAGIVFIGPPPGAIRAMGSKSAAKALMEKAGVPLVPGYHGERQQPDFLAGEADALGYPVLVKASAGGGGKGMRVVARPEEFAAALEGARREAAASFGDDRVLIEKYLERPRHIEMQVFADAHGNCVHLFERDCSPQRRHQKVIEEAPAPGFDEARRRAMGEAAVAAARAVSYVGAGTVEFIAEGDRFYFMEMNTRLQVEHPVTEMITGQDLVEWQLRVAAGERLPLAQEQLAIDGHAFEARIYAEDPARDFLPQTGRLRRLRPPPADGRHVRIDSGVREGDAITIHYDPMIAKLIVWDRDRGEALRRLVGALLQYEIAGLSTNVGFLARLAAHPEFAAGAVDTGFIARHRDALLPDGGAASMRVVAASVLALLLDQEAEAKRRAAASADPWSPWHRTDGWRLNGETSQSVRLVEGETAHEVSIRYRGGAVEIELAGTRLAARAERLLDGAVLMDLDGVRTRAAVVRHGPEFTVLTDGAAHRLVYVDPHASHVEEEAGGGRLTAPMPGRVVRVLVEPGATVRRGAALMVLEAMKMEHTIAAPTAGTVEAVNFAAGDLVEEGAELLVIAPAEGEGDDAAA